MIQEHECNSPRAIRLVCGLHRRRGHVQPLVVSTLGESQRVYHRHPRAGQLQLAVSTVGGCPLESSNRRAGSHRPGPCGLHSWRGLRGTRRRYSRFAARKRTGGQLAVSTSGGPQRLRVHGSSHSKGRSFCGLHRRREGARWLRTYPTCRPGPSTAYLTYGLHRRREPDGARLVSCKLTDGLDLHSPPSENAG